MTIRELLVFGKIQIASCSETPALDVELLLAQALEQRKEYLFSHSEEEVADTLRASFGGMIERRKRHEPVAYITGHQEFYAMDLAVSSEVLIPRADTEVLVDEALHIAGRLDLTKAMFIDVGTGSGAIALAFAKNQPEARVMALDFSLEALEIAHHNLKRHALTNVELIRSDLLSDLPPGLPSTLVIFANLPYIPTDELLTLDRSVQDFEPVLALDGGADGLSLYRKLFAQLSSIAAGKELHVIFECDPSQITKMKKMIRFVFLDPNIRIFRDLAGQERGGVVYRRK